VRPGEQRARRYPELVVEALPESGEHLQGGGLLAGGGEGDHQPGVRRLVERLGRAQVAQVRHRLCVCAGAAGRVGAAEYRFRPAACRIDRGGMTAQEVDIGQDVASPQQQRLLVQVARPRRVGSGGVSRLPGQLLEPVNVELTRPGVEPIAAPAFRREQFRASVAEDPAQPRHVALHLRERAGRRPLPPQRVDDRVPVHDGAGAQGEQTEHRALPDRSQRQEHAIPAGGHRTKDVDAHTASRPRRSSVAVGRCKPVRGECAGKLRSFCLTGSQRDGQFFYCSPAREPGSPLFQVAQRANADPGRRGQFSLSHSLSFAVPLDQRAYPSPGPFPVFLGHPIVLMRRQVVRKGVDRLDKQFRTNGV
jgi:hypothetical protein